MEEMIHDSPQSEADLEDHYSNTTSSIQWQMQVPPRGSTPPTSQEEKHSSVYPNICSEFEGMIETDKG